MATNSLLANIRTLRSLLGIAILITLLKKDISTTRIERLSWTHSSRIGSQKACHGPITISLQLGSQFTILTETRLVRGK